MSKAPNLCPTCNTVITPMEAKLVEVEAERSIGITEGDVVAHMNVASLHGELMAVKARAEAAEAIVEQLTNDPDYITVYRKGFEDGRAKGGE